MDREAQELRDKEAKKKVTEGRKIEWEASWP
jgi:hypothetical protein